MEQLFLQPPRNVKFGDGILDFLLEFFLLSFCFFSKVVKIAHFDRGSDRAVVQGL